MYSFFSIIQIFVCSIWLGKYYRHADGISSVFRSNEALRSWTRVNWKAFEIRGSNKINHPLIQFDCHHKNTKQCHSNKFPKSRTNQLSKINETPRNKHVEKLNFPFIVIDRFLNKQAKKKVWKIFIYSDFHTFLSDQFNVRKSWVSVYFPSSLCFIIFSDNSHLHLNLCYFVEISKNNFLFVFIYFQQSIKKIILECLQKIFPFSTLY